MAAAKVAVGGSPEVRHGWSGSNRHWCEFQSGQRPPRLVQLRTARLRLHPSTSAAADALVAQHSSAFVLRYWDSSPWSEHARAERFIATCRDMEEEGIPLAQSSSHPDTQGPAEVGATKDLTHHESRDRMPENDACRRLVELLGDLADGSPTPRSLLVKLGEEAAGIRPGVMALLDLVGGGHDRLAGGGLKPRFNDSSHGQVRHFAGIARSTVLLGPTLTKWLSEGVRGDVPASADGQLTKAAIVFAQELLTGELPVSGAADWVRENICGDMTNRVFVTKPKRPPWPRRASGGRIQLPAASFRRRRH